MVRKTSDKPWLHAASQFWCSTVRGKREYLDKDYKVACRKLKIIREQLATGQPVHREWLDAPFAELCDEFLADTKARKEQATYDAYRFRLLRALKVLGTSVRVCDLRKFHLSKIERKLASSCGSTTTRDTLAIVQTVLNWAVRLELIDTNQLQGYMKPRARRRTRTITDDEFWSLLRHTDSLFRFFLIALRLTGCRPKEVRTLIWEWVDLGRSLWIIPEHKTIHSQENPLPRMIPLHPVVMQICERYAGKPHLSTDHVFLNQHGRPYSKDGVVTKMARLRKRAGITVKGNEQVVLYSNRHTFGTEAAGKVTDIELAGLMGHTDIRSTQRYIHLNVNRLHDIRRRAQG